MVRIRIGNREPTIVDSEAVEASGPASVAADVGAPPKIVRTGGVPPGPDAKRSGLSPLAAELHAKHATGKSVLPPFGAKVDLVAQAAAVDIKRVESFATDKKLRTEILEELAARDVSLKIVVGAVPVQLVAHASVPPVEHEIALAPLFDNDNAAQALGRALPGFDAKDLAALLLTVAKSHVHNLVIDLTGDAEAVRTFALKDGLDGNALTVLSDRLASKDNLLAFAQRMESHDIDMRFELGGKAYELSGNDLRAVLAAADPAETLLERYVGLQYLPFIAFLADLSTLPGADKPKEDPLARDVISLSSDDLRHAGLLGNSGYDRAAAERALINALWDSDIQFTRTVKLAGQSIVPDAHASERDVKRVRHGRLFAAATGQSEVAWSGDTGRYTDALIEQMKKLGKLGLALNAARDFKTDDATQMATLAGDGAAIDRIPPERLHALLVANAEFGTAASDLPGNNEDVVNMRRALAQTPGPSLRDANVATVHNANRAQGLAAIDALVDRAVAGDGVIVYVSSHGTPDGVLMSDGKLVSNNDFHAIYREAESRGVRLVIISDSCYAGAQVEAIRNAEIQELVAANKAHPFLVRVAAFQNALGQMRRAAEDFAEYRSLVEEADRLFPSAEVSDFLGAALARSPSRHFLDILRADPAWGERVKALEAQVHKVLAQPRRERKARDAKLIPYFQELEKIDRAVEELKAAYDAIATDPALARTPEVAKLIADPNLVGKDGRLTPDEIVGIIDNADDVIRDMILAGNKPE